MKYLISISEQATAEQIQEYFVQNSITVESHLQNLGAIYIIECDTVPPAWEYIQHLSEDYTLTITPSAVECSTISTSDENWWKLSTINFKKFSESSIQHCVNTQPVDVYVVDSGLHAGHTEFSSISVDNIYTYTDTFSDDTGHGTAVASIIGGRTLRLANTRLKIVKIYGADSAAKFSELIEALDAIALSATQSEYRSIIHFSWTMPGSEFFEQQLQTLMSKNILVVCAAGNSNLSTSELSPPSMANIWCVGAYNQDFVPCDFTDYTSNPATTQLPVNSGSINCWAPGQDITVAQLNGGYATAGGTSIAAAIHTAASAYAIGCYWDTPTIATEKNYNTTMGITSLLSAANFSLVSVDEHRTVRSTTVKSQLNRAEDIFVSDAAPRYVFDNNKPLTRKCFLTNSIIDVTVDGLPPGLTVQNGWITGTPQIDFTPPSLPSITYPVTVSFGVANTAETYTVQFTITVRDV